MRLNTISQFTLQPSKQGGSSLIEVLVTVIVLAIGMLGLATMQNTSLKLSYDSYLRSQANFLAYDLIDRIRANPDAERYEITDDATITKKDCFSGDTCTVSDMRQFDLYYWRAQAEELMPNAKVEVTFDDSQNLYSMRLRWQDSFDDDVADDEVKEFIYHFQIDN